MLGRQSVLAIASAGLLVASFSGAAGAVRLFRDRATWEAEMVAAGAKLFVTDTFDRDIANAATIVFESGVVSAGQRGRETNDVLQGAYFGNVDSDQASESAQSAGELATFESITWTFPKPIIGFGADFFSTTSGEGLQLLSNFGSDERYVVDFFSQLGKPGDGFLGIVGEAPFREVTFRSREDNFSLVPNEFWGADNLTFGSTAEPQSVPEPLSAIAVVFLGLSLGSGALLDRRKS